MTSKAVLECPGCAKSLPFSSSFLSSNDLKISQCPICELGFLDRMPDPDESRVLYERLGESYFLDPGKLQSDHLGSRYDPEMKLLSGLFPLNGRSLDIGCATGAFLKRLRAVGQDGEGIEIASASVEWGRKNHDLRMTSGDFFSSDLPSGSFQLLTAWATLEHLEHPIRFLEKCRNILAPGGYLAVSVPNVESLSHKLLSGKFRMVHPCHVLYFHGKSLENMLFRCGFETLKRETVRFNPLVFFRDLLRLRDDETQAALQTTGQTYRLKRSSVFRPLRLLHRLVLRVLEPMNLGEDLLVLARLRRDAC